MKKLMQIISVVVFLMVIISFPPVQPVGAFSLQGFLDRWDLDDEPDDVLPFTPLTNFLDRWDLDDEPSGVGGGGSNDDLDDDLDDTIDDLQDLGDRVRFMSRSAVFTGMDDKLAEKVQDLIPLRGMSYTPHPSDQTKEPAAAKWNYFDSDFTNSSFPGLWGASVANARGDLKKMHDLNVNFLHLYDWSVPALPYGPPPEPGLADTSYRRNHIPFLDECAKQGIKVTIPISNYFLGRIKRGDSDKFTPKEQIQGIVAETLRNGHEPHAAAVMWAIGNEFVSNKNDTGIPRVERPETIAEAKENAKIIATVAQWIIEKEVDLKVTDDDDRLPITSTVTFGELPRKGTPPNEIGLNPPSIWQIQLLKDAFQGNPFLAEKRVWEERFIATIQTFNDGPFLENYIESTFPENFGNVPFFFGELGADILSGGGTEAAQADWLAGQLKAAGEPKGNFMGSCVFQWMNQTARKTGNAEPFFGIHKFTGTFKEGTILPAGYIPGGTYRIDDLREKPSYNSVRDAWK